MFATLSPIESQRVRHYGRINRRITRQRSGRQRRRETKEAHQFLREGLLDPYMPEYRDTFLNGTLSFIG